ncbi:cation-translocating P-type ATPase [Candidatus Micrarchaeota archaeon]|nr:cation-translocating P-type ATPase [Candidatus Micrarchaeota archaeon]
MIPMEWHEKGIKEILSDLHSGKSGLTGLQAEERLAQYGLNSIIIEKRISPLKIFLEQFKNALVIVLLFAAVVSFAVSYIGPGESDYLDSILIFAIVIANAFFGFFQEYKAERTIEALSKMSAPKATVLRDGKETEIQSDDVVPGDILLLREGDKVAADARIIESFSLHADESALTGESVPSLKSTGKLSDNLPLAERKNMLYMNSVITRGRGTAVVVETGLKTEVGKIAKEISDAPEKTTQFQIEIEDVGKKIMYITLFVLFIIVTTEFLLRTGDLLFIFIAAVALGVAAIPEGLPAVVTLSLSIATNRMLRQKALTRRLSTIQDLGSVDVICSDKTGTLTENTMTVTRMYVPGALFYVSGSGLAKLGELISREGAVEQLDQLLKCAVLCNDSRETEQGFRGDPTEIAVLIPAYKAKMDVDMLRQDHPRSNEIPFSSDRKLMSTLHGDTSFVKGAPEEVLSRCKRIKIKNSIRKMTKKDAEEISRKNIDMAGSALRVLAFAYTENGKKNPESDLIFLGLMGMIDPPREGVKEAIQDCRKAGIRVVMITGDNKYTAAAIGRDLGFRDSVITGTELDALSEEQLLKKVEEHDIYARTSPKHKVMLLRALQKNRHIVCMTGDGVNDAAAIKNSDVGIAMGIRGTEVTKQASDMIILDDNFITIKNSIAEGRASFTNVRKFVTLLLGANTSEVLAVLIATLSPLGISSKIAIQLLWINLLTDGLPALALGADPPSSDVMQNKPRDRKERIISKNVLYFIAVIGIFEMLAVILIYAFYSLNHDIIKAQTMFFTSFIVFEIISVYLVRWRYNTRFLTNKWLHLSVLASFVLQIVLLYTDLSSWFNVTAPDLMDWLITWAVGLVFVAIVWGAMKMEKHIIR